jgi:hypothetical protein
MGFTEDVVWPDVTLGMKRADELGADITPDGQVITSNYVIEMPPETPVPQDVPSTTIPLETPQMPPQSATEAPSYGFDVARLIEVANQEEIMAANGGQFPLTPEQINATVHTLVTSGKLVMNNETDKA